MKRFFIYYFLIGILASSNVFSMDKSRDFNKEINEAYKSTNEAYKKFIGAKEIMLNFFGGFDSSTTKEFITKEIDTFISKFKALYKEFEDLKIIELKLEREEFLEDFRKLKKKEDSVLEEVKNKNNFLDKFFIEIKEEDELVNFYNNKDIGNKNILSLKILENDNLIDFLEKIVEKLNKIDKEELVNELNDNIYALKIRREVLNNLVYESKNELGEKVVDRRQEASFYKVGMEAIGKLYLLGGVTGAAISGNLLKDLVSKNLSLFIDSRYKDGRSLFKSGFYLLPPIFLFAFGMKKSKDVNLAIKDAQETLVPESKKDKEIRDLKVNLLLYQSNSRLLRKIKQAFSNVIVHE